MDLTFSSPDPSSVVKQIKMSSPCTTVVSERENYNVNITYVTAYCIKTSCLLYTDFLVICDINRPWCSRLRGDQNIIHIANCMCHQFQRQFQLHSFPRPHIIPLLVWLTERGIEQSQDKKQTCLSRLVVTVNLRLENPLRRSAMWNRISMILKLLRTRPNVAQTRGARIPQMFLVVNAVWTPDKRARVDGSRWHLTTAGTISPVVGRMTFVILTIESSRVDEFQNHTSVRTLFNSVSTKLRFQLLTATSRKSLELGVTCTPSCVRTQRFGFHSDFTFTTGSPCRRIVLLRLGGGWYCRNVLLQLTSRACSQLWTLIGDTYWPHMKLTCWPPRRRGAQHIFLVRQHLWWFGYVEVDLWLGYHSINTTPWLQFRRTRGQQGFWWNQMSATLLLSSGLSLVLSYGSAQKRWLSLNLKLNPVCWYWVLFNRQIHSTLQ